MTSFVETCCSIQDGGPFGQFDEDVTYDFDVGPEDNIYVRAPASFLGDKMFVMGDEREREREKKKASETEVGKEEKKGEGKERVREKREDERMLEKILREDDEEEGKGARPKAQGAPTRAGEDPGGTQVRILASPLPASLPPLSLAPSPSSLSLSDFLSFPFSLHRVLARSRPGGRVQGKAGRRSDSDRERQCGAIPSRKERNILTKRERGPNKEIAMPQQKRRSLNKERKKGKERSSVFSLTPSLSLPFCSIPLASSSDSGLSDI